MTKIWYPVKIQLLSFTCEGITVVMTTSGSANGKLPPQHRARLPFHSQISRLEKQDGIFQLTTKFRHKYFRRQAKRKDWWKVCSNDR